MLKVEFKRNVYENEMEFNGIDLPIHKIVITDVEASKLQTLFCFKRIDNRVTTIHSV